MAKFIEKAIANIANKGSKKAAYGSATRKKSPTVNSFGISHEMPKATP